MKPIPLAMLLAAALPARGATPPRRSVDLDQPDDTTQPVEDVPEAPDETAPTTVGRLKPPPAGAEPHPSVPPGQDYTVQKGDTLWDISSAYLANPWFWPKLWSYNPQIENPHWIYPGSNIRFYPAGGGTAVAAPIASAPQEADVSVGGQYKIGYVPPRALLAETDGFVTPAELAEAGKIRASFEGKEMLASLDTVYVDFQGRAARPGDRYVVFRTVREVRNPETHALLGYLTEIRGTVQVTRVGHVARDGSGSPLATAVIDKSFGVVERGDLVGPWGEKFLRNVLHKDADRSIAGLIVASFIPEIENLGQHNRVFIDLGRRDGVQEGNEFEVLERRDGMDEDMTHRWTPGLPTEVIGRLMVVDAKETASEAVVVSSVRELEVGDHIAMFANQ